MQSPPQIKKPPKGYRNPLKAFFTPPPGKIFHGQLQKDRVMLWGYLGAGFTFGQKDSVFRKECPYIVCVRNGSKLSISAINLHSGASPKSYD
jgi:hypothetical protein